MNNFIIAKKLLEHFGYTVEKDGLDVIEQTITEGAFSEIAILNDEAMKLGKKLQKYFNEEEALEHIDLAKATKVSYVQDESGKITHIKITTPITCDIESDENYEDRLGMSIIYALQSVGYKKKPNIEIDTIYKNFTFTALIKV